METSRLAAVISAAQGRGLGAKGLLLMALLLVPTVFYSFLLFHTLAELFAVLVAVMVAVVGWQTYAFSRNDFLMFLATGFFWVGALDLLHTVTYTGLGIVPGDDPDVPTQFWLLGRYLQAGILLLAPWMIAWRTRPGAVFVAVGALAVAASLLVFSGRFPTAFTVEDGLSPFKIWSEYAIIAVLLLALANLWRHRRELDAEVLRLIAAAIVLTVLSEFIFTLYRSVYGIEIFLGHLGKLAAYWLVFVAIVDTTLKTPFRMLARRVSTYDAVPDATVVVDGGGVVRQVNRAAAALMRGVDAADAGDCHTLFHPQQWSAAQCPVCKEIRAGIDEPVTLEVAFADRGIWHAITLSPVDVADAGYAGVVHVSHDITRLKSAEQELQRRNEQLSSILDSVGEGIYGVDLQGRATFVNPALERITGWDAESLVGRDMHATLHAPHGAAGGTVDACPVHRTLADGRTRWSDDDRFTRRDGTPVAVDLTSAPMRDDAGVTTGAVVVVRDITERKAAAAALRSSEQKYRGLMENASDAILVVGPAGHFVDANRHAELMLGYTREELQAMTPPDIHPAEERERLAAVFQKLEEQGHSRTEHMALRRDGTLLPVEVVGTRVEYESGVLYLVTFRDISERRQIERERRRHQQELEMTVAARTRELQEANREMESFSYSVSHDLRAPLRAINGFGQILAEEYADRLDEEGRDYLARMENAASRMSQMIDGLLGLSRVTRREMNVEPVDLSALAEELAELVAGADPQRSVEWRIAEGLSASGDPTLVRLLLQNLLENAWKFTAGREPAVIEVGRQPLPGAEVYYVRDNGIGFEPEAAEGLFKPFARLQTTGDYAGSGIGLATVQRIVRRHGGRCWAEGRPGEGAIVYFSLAPADESGGESSNM